MSDVWDLIAERHREREGLQAGPDPELGQSVVPALGASPDEVAAARKLSERSGLPLPIVQSDPKRAEREATLREIDLRTLPERAPATAEVLKDRELAKVAHDDIANMTWIERAVRDVAQRFDRGQRINELGPLGAEAAAGVLLGREEDPNREFRIRTLQAKDAQELDYNVDMGSGAAGFLASIPPSFAEMLPMMGSGLVSSVEGGAAGAVGGAAVGAAAGLAGGPAAPATVPAGAVAGATEGYAVGSALGLYISSAKQEWGHSFLELRKVQDENGQPIDQRLAAGISMAVGATAGAVEMWGLGKLLRKIPGADRLMGPGMREAAKQTLADPAFRRFASELAGTMTESAFSEGATEGLQEFIAIAGELAAMNAKKAVVGLASGKLEGMNIDDFKYEVDGPGGEKLELRGYAAIWGRVMSAMAQGAAGGAGTAGAGRTMRLVTDSERARAAVDRIPGVQRLQRGLEGSKLLQRDPEAFKRHVREAGKQAGVETIYVEPQAFREFFEGIEPEKAEALFEEIPELREQQEDIGRTGADVRIRIENWLSHPEMVQALEQHARFDPLDMTAKEALAFESDLEREVGTVQEQVAGARDEASVRKAVEDHVRGELLKVYPETVVGPMVQITLDRMETRAQREGRTLEQYVDEEGIFRVQGPQDGVAPEKTGVLPPTLEDRLQGVRDEDSIRRLLGDTRAGKLPKITRGTPIVDLLRSRGGVKRGSVLAGELESMGFTPGGKGSFGGLIVKKGRLDKRTGQRREPIGDLDNFSADEFPELAAVVGFDPATGYLDRQGLLDELSRELAGESRVVNPEEQRAFDEASQQQDELRAVLDEMGLDLEADDEALVPALLERFATREFQQRVAETHDEAARTPEFKAWAGDAEVVLDPESHTFLEGQPVVVATYHGTTHEFDTIDRDIASFENDLGKAFYSSTSRGDVDRNYAGIGPDLTGRLERETEYLEAIIPDDPTAYGLPEDADGVAIRSRAEALAREKLVGKAGEQGKVIPVFVKLEKPALFGYDRKSTSLIDLEGDYNEELDEFSDSENLLTIIDAAREAESNYLDFDADAFLGRLEEYRDRGAISAKQLVETVTSENYATTLDGSSLASNQIAQDILRALGFDGAIVIDAQERFRGMDIGENVQHVVVFEPNAKNVKAVTSKAFNPQSDKIYDQPAYHGSHARFNRFGLEFIGTGEGARAFGWGLYFSNEKGIADFYEQEISYRKIVDAFRRELPDDADFEDALAAADSMSPEHARVIRALAADDWLGFDHPSQAITAAFKDLQNYDPSQELRNAVKAARGQVYEAEIPDDENLLDWDKPIAKQHPNVLRILKESGLLREFKENKSDFSSPMRTRGDRGEHFYEWLAWRERDQTPENTVGIAGWTSVTQTMNDTVQKPEAASRILAGLGILGHRYKAGQIANVKSGATNFVIYDDKAIQIARTFYSSAAVANAPEATRGSIRMTDDLTDVVIRFTEAADLSTFLHESGHLWLAQLAKDAARSGGQLADDLEIVKAWGREKVGTDDINSDALQELWARSIEAYYFEGKAPTIALERIFARFSSWLIGIYKRLRGIPGYKDALTPEIRGVMDRLIATDEQIAETAAARGLEAFDAEALGMTPEQTAEYQRTVEEGRAEAQRRLLPELMEEARRAASAEWKELRAGVRAEVEAQVNARPAFQAKQWLRTGKALEGQPTPIVPHAKLDQDALVELYGKEIKKLLPGLFQKKGGLHPDVVAELFGFNNGDDLVRALEAAGDRRKVIEEETDAEMERRHGKPETRDTMEAKALEALTNKKQLKALLMAERAVATKAGGKVIPIAIARATAERIVRGTRYRDLTPGRYRAAALKASREAVKLIAKGDYPEAQRALRLQINNLLMESEARKAIAEADRALDYLNDIQSRKSREKLGLAGADYLEQIEGMLERFNLSKQSLKKIDKLHGLAAWIQKQTLAGEAVVIDEKLANEAFRASWKELSINDFLALRDAVKNIEHLAKLKNRFTAARDRRQMEEVRAELVDAIQRNAIERPPPDTLNPRKGYAFKTGLVSWDAPIRKIQSIIDYLDGGDPQGPWRRNVMNVVNDVTNDRLELSKKHLEPFGQAIRDHIRPNLKEYTTDFFAPELGTRVNRLEVLGFALNWGSPENVQRIVDGNKFPEAAVQALLDRVMTREDWEFVKKSWGIVGGLKPMLYEDAKKASGIQPADAQTRTIKTPFGEIEGQYFPIVYDPSKSLHTQEQAEQALMAGIETGFTAVAKLPGSAIERANRVTGKPVLIDLSVIPAHIDEIITRVTARDRLTQVYKLLRHEDVRKAFLATTMGEDYYKLFEGWLRDIAADRVIDSRVLGRWEKILRNYRLGYSVSKLALRETTLAGQVLGNMNASGLMAEKVPNWKRHMLNGWRKAYGGFNPKRSWSVAKEVMEASVFMRNRLKTRDREVQEIRRRTIADLATMPGQALELVHKAADAAMSTIGYMQFLGVDLPVWLGAYEGGISELDMTHEDAVRFADSIIEMSQGGGAIKDLSAIQRGGEMLKALTVFGGYTNTAYNQNANAISMGVKQKSPWRAIRGVMLAFFGPIFGYAFIRAALTGRGGPPEDAEDWTDILLWSIGLTLTEAMNLIPILREGSSIPSTVLGGGRFFDGTQPVESFFKGLDDLAHPEDAKEFAFDVVKFISPWLGGMPPDRPVDAIEKMVRDE